MKKGKVEFHSQGQSGNIYYIIGAVISSARCGALCKNSTESRNIMICGSGYRTPKATKRR